MSDEHPTRQLLERFSVRDLSDQDKHAIDDHLRGCSECRGWLADLEAERRALMIRLPPARLISNLQKRRLRRIRGLETWTHKALALCAGLAAFGVALLVWPRVPDSTREDVRFKGPGLTVHLRRQNEVRVLSPSDTVQSGDALRLTLTLVKPSKISAFFVDARGRVDTFWATPTLLPEGVQTLSGSAIIEDPCVNGWIVVGQALNDIQSVSDQLSAAVRKTPSAPPQFPRGLLVQELRCQ